MKYLIEDENGDQISIARRDVGAIVTLEVSGRSAVEFYLTLDEFREFRRAVGYVWQEVEDK